MYMIWNIVTEEPFVMLGFQPIRLYKDAKSAETRVVAIKEQLKQTAELLSIKKEHLRTSISDGEADTVRGEIARYQSILSESSASAMQVREITITSISP